MRARGVERIHLDNRREMGLVHHENMGVDVRVDMGLIRQIIGIRIEIEIIVVKITREVIHEIDGTIRIKDQNKRNDLSIVALSMHGEIGIMIQIMIGNDGKTANALEIVGEVVIKEVANQALSKDLEDILLNGGSRILEPANQ